MTKLFRRSSESRTSQQRNEEKRLTSTSGLKLTEITHIDHEDNLGDAIGAMSLATLAVVVTWSIGLPVEDNIEWYDDLPAVYQNGKKIYPVGYNVAAYDPETGRKIDPTGTANNENPWLHTGGTDDCGSELHIRRQIIVPAGKWIELEWVKRTIDAPQELEIEYVAGTYPPGTKVSEFFYDGTRHFETRVRLKTNRMWITTHDQHGAKPKGYRPVDNCTECHEDIGKHSFELDSAREWYGTVRGLERDGPIRWHPFAKWGRGGEKPEIRKEVRNFVRWKR